MLHGFYHSVLPFVRLLLNCKLFADLKLGGGAIDAQWCVFDSPLLVSPLPPSLSLSLSLSLLQSAFLLGWGEKEFSPVSASQGDLRALIEILGVVEVF